MTAVIFTIPSSREDLLNTAGGNYMVRDVLSPNEILQKLKDTRMALKEEGPQYIIEYFDTYYSILQYAKKLNATVIVKAFEELQRAVVQLDEYLDFLFSDLGNLNDDLKSKMTVVLKMLIYIFSQFVKYLEQKESEKGDDLLRKNKNRAKKEDDTNMNKTKIIKSLNSIVEMDINIFWDPPVIEQDLTNTIADIGFLLLHNVNIKPEKELKATIFGLFGNLIKTFDYGKTFVMKLVQSIRVYEHFVQCVPEGVKLLVQHFKVHTLVHKLVQEATEWQADETFQDIQGSRSCSLLLTELAVLLPDLMIPEVLYLNQYLHYESVALRTSVLNVITEVVSKVLTKHDLSDTDRKSRDDFLRILLEHLRDASAIVRSKVIQNIARLQKESAIPLSFQEEILRNVIKHLRDKAAQPRKAAIQCITTFLEHNPFGGILQLSITESELVAKTNQLNQMEETYREAKLAKLRELNEEWSVIREDLKRVINESLENEDDDEDDEDKENENEEVNKEETVSAIRSNLKEKKFDEAFKLCKLLKNQINEWKEMRKLEQSNEIEFYLFIMKTLFMDTSRIMDELRTRAGMTEEHCKNIEATEKAIVFLERTVSFLKIVDSAIEPIKKLLFSTMVSDMHEAIAFFTAGYKFQIDRINDGVLEMLTIMQHKEADRKEAVVEAFRNIYLITDSNNMAEHTTIIVKRLLSLIKEISLDKFDDLQSIVAEWTSKGILDNSVIDTMWQYYTKRVPTSDEDSRTCAILLRMCALGRETIIKKNMKVVTTVAFSDRGRDDMMFLAYSLRLLCVCGRKKIDIKSKDDPFKIKDVDPLFNDLTNILVGAFTSKVPFYSEAMRSALEFIFKLCTKPFEVVKKILHEASIAAQSNDDVYVTIRFCELLGSIALNTLNVLDDSVFRELKRRSNIREERKNAKNKKNGARKSIARKSLLANSSMLSVTNETMMEGGTPVDEHAEFIANVLENQVLNNHTALGQYVPFLLEICTKPVDYSDICLQKAALTALMRFMLISPKFCEEHIRLLFTIFEKTIYPDLKCLILIHCSDFLCRFPNVFEPWSDRIYAQLKDPLLEVRKTALYTLSSLILRDLIRAHQHIAEMAACLIDTNEEMTKMCRMFFLRLSQKESNLVNLIPDIFSVLAKMECLNQENFRYIMKFIFELIDKSKHMETLVDRFCIKFTPVSDSDLQLNRNITYCLSLLTYNEKALRKLIEYFPLFKQHMHDEEIYSAFQAILGECDKQKTGKVDLKPVITELEKLIASVFEVTEDGQPPRAKPVFQKPQKGKPGRKKNSRKSSGRLEEEPAKTKRGKKKNSKSDSDDDDFDISVQSSTKKSKRQNTRKIIYSDSD